VYISLSVLSDSPQNNKEYDAFLGDRL